VRTNLAHILCHIASGNHAFQASASVPVPGYVCQDIRMVDENGCIRLEILHKFANLPFLPTSAGVARLIILPRDYSYLGAKWMYRIQDQLDFVRQMDPGERLSCASFQGAIRISEAARMHGLADATAQANMARDRPNRRPTASSAPRRGVCWAPHKKGCR
jgi:hypothetical protein